MSERLYSCLLRLYPRRFRERYAEEAMQLFRDRLHEETGVVRRIRLWLDLLTDFAVSLPMHFGDEQPALVPQSDDRVPSFHTLGGDAPRASRVLFGAVLTIAATAALIPMTRVVVRQARELGELRPFGHRGISWGGSGAFGERSHSREVIELAVDDIRKFYVDKEVAEKAVDALKSVEQSADAGNADGLTLATKLTKELQQATGDPHLEVIYSESVLPDPTKPRTPEQIAFYATVMMRDNCSMERLTVLPGNIGYMKLNSFPEVSICGETIRQGLQSLNASDAVVFDLRENRGGYPEMVMQVASYLFDRPEYMYSPRENTTARSWTRSPVDGSKLAGKPVYILTSNRTASAAEQFSYDLKMLKRATLVGEKTRGQAHAGVLHRLSDHFGIAIPQARGINPFGGRDWEGVGIEPDVRTPEADALEAATKLAAKPPGRR